MAEPLIDLERLAAGVWWRRHVWAAFASLGLVCAALFSLMSPPAPTAVSRVLVARTDDQVADRMQLMQTDVALSQTTSVAQEALAELGEGVSASELLAGYQVQIITANILQIRVSGTSVESASRRAQALSDAFVAAQVQRAVDEADAQAGALLARQAELQRALVDLNNEVIAATAAGAGVGSGSVEATQLSANLDALYARRAGLQSQIIDLGRRADEARIAAGRVEVGTRVLGPPQVAQPDLLRTGVVNSAVGLVLGLGAGLGLAAVLSLIRVRPLFRGEIAAELGAPVIVEVPRARRGLLERLGRGRSARQRRRASATLARLVRSSETPVVLLELGCPRTAADVGAELARQLSDDRPVELVDDLRRGRARVRARRSDGRVRVVSRTDVAAHDPGTSGTLRLVVGSVGPGAAWTDLADAGPQALLLVRAGRVTRSALRTASQQLAFAGVRLLGVVLIHPYPLDPSDGARWDAVPTDLRLDAHPQAQCRNGHRPVTAGALARPYEPAPHVAPGDANDQSDH